jgi:hypothetical protein
VKKKSFCGEERCFSLSFFLCHKLYAKDCVALIFLGGSILFEVDKKFYC